MSTSPDPAYTYDPTHEIALKGRIATTLLETVFGGALFQPCIERLRQDTESMPASFLVAGIISARLALDEKMSELSRTLFVIAGLLAQEEMSRRYKLGTLPHALVLGGSALNAYMQGPEAQREVDEWQGLRTAKMQSKRLH